jgi:hypothetical protein
VALAHRLERYPFPLAYPARALTTARDPADHLDRAAHFVEMSAVTVGILVLGWCRTRAISLQAAARWQQSLDGKGASLGGWIVLLRGAEGVLAEHPNDPVARSVRLTVANIVPA